jgi:hypothetical protein
MAGLFSNMTLSGSAAARVEPPAPQPEPKAPTSSLLGMAIAAGSSAKPAVDSEEDNVPRVSGFSFLRPKDPEPPLEGSRGRVCSPSLCYHGGISPFFFVPDEVVDTAPASSAFSFLSKQQPPTGQPSASLSLPLSLYVAICPGSDPLRSCSCRHSRCCTDGRARSAWPCAGGGCDPCAAAPARFSW